MLAPVWRAVCFCCGVVVAVLVMDVLRHFGGGSRRSSLRKRQQCLREEVSGYLNKYGRNQGPWLRGRHVAMTS
jgi:hypothetical protein